MWKIFNGNEWKTIRNTSMAMFTSNLIQFNPHTFDNVSLELIPRVLEFVQQEMGQSGFGVNSVGQRNIEYCLARVYEV